MSGQRLTWLLAALVPVSLFVAIAFGAVDMPLAEIFKALLALESGDDQVALIIQDIRLPRAVLTALVGALLAICGAAMQGLFRNPLADPSLIGVTAGASAGASLMIVFGGLLAGLAGLSLVSMGAFIGGVVTAALVYRLSTGPAGTSVATMLLAGIAITALAGSLTSLLEYYASNQMLRRISLWHMGGLDGANWLRVGVVAAMSVVVLGVLPAQAKALNAMLLGESEARHLGVGVDRLKRRLVLLVAAGVGVSVAVAGAIAFVGLVVPHIIRLIMGPDHRWLLPASALGGAALLLWADTLARLVIAPSELPVGLLTSLLGAPFFISLLRRRHEFGMP